MLESPIQQNADADKTLVNQRPDAPSFESEPSPYADPPLQDTFANEAIDAPLYESSGFYASSTIDAPPVPPVQPPHNPVDGGQPKPPLPPRKSWRFPALMALAVLLIFGGGLFAGTQLFKSGDASSLVTVASPSQSSTSGTTVESQQETAISKVRGAIVEITTTLANGQGIGSGIVLDKNGYIATNNHVVEGAQTIKVTLADGTTHSATLVGTDPADDLAVIKIDNPPTNLAVATLGDSSKLTVGQEVLAIGNPLGITQTVTHGIVSALNRTMSESATNTQAGATIPNMIQTDAPINPGNSGGALIDLNGNVVGMPTLGATNTETNTAANGIGFAIPSNRISSIAQQLIQNGKVTHTGRAALGVSVASVDSQVQAQQGLSIDSGAYIASVTSGSAADRAGLKVGDVIVKIDNQTIDSSDTLGQVLATKNPGDQINVTVYRGSQQITLNVTLGELAAS